MLYGRSLFFLLTASVVLSIEALPVKPTSGLPRYLNYTYDPGHKIGLSLSSVRELAKLTQNKQEQAYQLAKKMAEQDRKLSPTSRLVAKAVKKIQNDPTANIPLPNDESDRRWLKLTTRRNFASPFFFLCNLDYVH